MRILFLLLLSLISGLVVADGNRLLGGCKVVIDIIDGRENSGSELRAGSCLGTVQGMRNLNMFYEVTLDRNQLFFCIPERVTAGQLARVVVNYLEKNPAMLHENDAGLVLRSFMEAYPCE